VVGVVGGSHKIAAAKACGAAAVVDRSAGDPWPALERLAPRGFHHVFDANGADSLRRSFDHLAAPGKLVIYGFHGMLPRGGERPSWPRLAWTWLRTPSFSPLELTGTNRSVMGFNLSYLFEERAMFERAIEDVLAGFESGAFRPPEVRTFPLERVADAHGALESGETTGKLVLVP
jgi:NADPH:quinone reductase-like Zn-dependent oxidoreductase